MNTLRSLLLISGIALFSASSLRAQEALQVLHHQGKITVFTGTDLTKAHDAAADGDTLFLNPGRYAMSGSFTKCITLIGAGAEGSASTTLDLSTFDIPSTAASQNMRIESLSFISSPYFGGKGLKEILCRKVYFQYNVCFGYVRSTAGNGLAQSSTYSSINVTLDRCWVTRYMDARGNDTHVTSYSSRFSSGVDGPNRSLVFFNCSFSNIYLQSDSPSCTFVNCCFNHFGGNPFLYFSNSIFQNCLFREDFTYGAQQNCYHDTNLSADTDEEWIALFKEKGYLGTDGTVVGYLGGTAPYSLTPHVPSIASHSISYDQEQKKFKVNVKFQAQ